MIISLSSILVLVGCEQRNNFKLTSFDCPEESACGLQGAVEPKELPVTFKITNTLKNASVFIDRVELKYETSDEGNETFTYPLKPGDHTLSLKNNIANTQAKILFDGDKPETFVCSGMKKLSCILQRD